MVHSITHFNAFIYLFIHLFTVALFVLQDIEGEEGGGKIEKSRHSLKNKCPVRNIKNNDLAVQQTTETLSHIHFWAECFSYTANEAVGCSAAVAKRQITFAVKDTPLPIHHPPTHTHTHSLTDTFTHTPSHNKAIWDFLSPLFLIAFSHPSFLSLLSHRLKTGPSKSRQQSQMTLLTSCCSPSAYAVRGIATSQAAREWMFNKLKKEKKKRGGVKQFFFFFFHLMAS